MNEAEQKLFMRGVIAGFALFVFAEWLDFKAHQSRRVLHLVPFPDTKEMVPSPSESPSVS